jgi:hypothetical protein
LWIIREHSARGAEQGRDERYSCDGFHRRRSCFTLAIDCFAIEAPIAFINLRRGI